MTEPQQLISDWVSPQEAAEYLRITKQTVLSWCRDDKVVWKRLGYRTIRIKTASIDKMMARSKG